MPEDRPFDIAIFGATGFTGAYVALALARLLAEQHPCLPASGRPLRVVLSGRSSARLQALQDRLQAEVPGHARERFSTSLADVNDAASLAALAASCTLLLNCVGPFSLYGEPVVAACVARCTHYLDITGEPAFMERMELQFGEEAAAKGLQIVPCSAFDSIPADLGVAFAVEQLRARCGSAADTVTSFLSLRTGPAGFGGHFATLESAVRGFGSVAELQRTRRAYALRYPHLARVPLAGAPLRKRGAWFWTGAAWALPFMGSDASVVRRSQRALHAARLAAEAQGRDAPLPQPVQYEAYFTVASTWSLCLTVLFGGALSLLAPWAWGRRLLLAFPAVFSGGIFTHEGPTPAQLAETTFAMEFMARGAGGAEVKCVVRGPEPGYVATPLLLLGAALTLLEEGGSSAAAHGLLTPATAFRGTGLISRLRQLGIEFECTSVSK